MRKPSTARNKRTAVRKSMGSLLAAIVTFSGTLFFSELGMSPSYSDRTSQGLGGLHSQLGSRDSNRTKPSNIKKDEEPLPKSELEIGIEKLEREIADISKEALMNGSITKEQLKVITNPIPAEQQKIKRTLNQNLILPPPRQTNSTTVVVVLSTENHFVKRQAIRELWAKGHDNVYFAVGHSNCQESHTNSTANGTWAGNDPRHERHNEPAASCRYRRHAFLYLEQLKYNDLLEVPLEEFYNGLPDKLVYSYNWVLQNLPSQVNWIAKVDDDMFVRVSSLEHYVRKYNPNVPIVIGKINQNVVVPDKGKWAELDYDNTLYPFFPHGSAGHIANRVVAEYIAKHEATRLFRYQGEDTSIGIWLQEGVDKYHDLDFVTYIDARKLLTNDFVSRCADPKTLIVGHDLIIQDLIDCHQYADEGPRDKVYSDQSANYIDHSRTRQKRNMPLQKGIRGHI